MTPLSIYPAVKVMFDYSSTGLWDAQNNSISFSEVAPLVSDQWLMRHVQWMQDCDKLASELLSRDSSHRLPRKAITALQARGFKLSQFLLGELQAWPGQRTVLFMPAIVDADCLVFQDSVRVQKPRNLFESVPGFRPPAAYAPPCPTRAAADDEYESFVSWCDDLLKEFERKARKPVVLSEEIGMLEPED